MLQFSLPDRILKFVESFGIVHVNQIYRFFRKEHKNSVTRVISTLQHDGLIHAQQEDYFSIRKELSNPITNYADRMKAIYVMCLLEDSEVKWFTLDEYPWEILFVNNDGVCYDVTVFNSQNWVTKYALIKKFRSRPLLKDIPDPLNYIAVVPNEDLIPKIRDLGFAYYALIDNNGKATLLHDEAEQAD